MNSLLIIACSYLRYIRSLQSELHVVLWVVLMVALCLLTFGFSSWKWLCHSSCSSSLLINELKTKWRIPSREKSFHMKQFCKNLFLFHWSKHIAHCQVEESFNSMDAKSGNFWISISWLAFTIWWGMCNKLFSQQYLYHIDIGIGIRYWTNSSMVQA